MACDDDAVVNMTSPLVYVMSAFSLLLASCAGAQPSGMPPSSEVPPSEAQSLPAETAWPVTSRLSECEDDGLCAEGFLVGSVLYQTSCGRILSEFVTDAVLAEGSHTVHVIEDVGARTMVAYLAPAQACDEGETVPSGLAWHFAFAADREPPDIVCTIEDLGPLEERADDC